MATHVPVEVPLWLCPQLSFHTYLASAPCTEINAALRVGRRIAAKRTIPVRRPERPGDDVRLDGGSASPGSEERLSKALGAAVGAVPVIVPATSSSVASRGADDWLDSSNSVAMASVSVAPAWGAIAEQHRDGRGASGNIFFEHTFEHSLEQADGVGSGLETVEEDWLKA